MTPDTTARRVPAPSSRFGPGPGGIDLPGGSSGDLGDILERILDKGLVIAGDIRVNLLDIELLTIKLRLVVASVDTARSMGIDWWERDPWLTSGDPVAPPAAVGNRPDGGPDR